MLNLKDYTRYIEESIGGVNLPESPRDLYDPLRYFLKLGGKRIRPILTLLAAEMFDGKKEEVIDQALAIELFHNFTLIHDDIMDDAPLRRNQTTVHEKWNNNVGILSGDALLIVAYQYLAKAPNDKLSAILHLFNTTSIEVCEGQQMDMDFETRMDVSTSEYIEMIRLKTSVLLGCALKMGAILSGASEQDQNHLYDFGVNIGIAFQIQDDILDLYADPDKFGKQVGGDVVANKKTMLYLTAISKSSREQIEGLKQLQKEEDIELKLARTKEIFDHLEVKEDCKQMMEHHYQLAVNSLEKIDVDHEHSAKLKELGAFMMHRDN